MNITVPKSVFQKCCLSNYPNPERCDFYCDIFVFASLTELLVCVYVCDHSFVLGDAPSLDLPLFFGSMGAVSKRRIVKCYSAAANIADTNGTRMLLFREIAHQSRNATHDFMFSYGFLLFVSFLFLVLSSSRCLCLYIYFDCRSIIICTRCINCKLIRL